MCDCGVAIQNINRVISKEVTLFLFQRGNKNTNKFGKYKPIMYLCTMITGRPPRHRLLISPDAKPETSGGIFLPLSLQVVNTGTVVQTGCNDIQVGDHVAWDDTLPSLPEIELNGRNYLSIHRNNIKLIHQTSNTKS